MKYIFALLLVLTIGCYKTPDNVETKQCYTCEIQNTPYFTTFKKDVCTNRIDTMHFEDANGNTLGNWTCVPK